MQGLVHVAGNAVVDVLVRDVEVGDGPALDSWGANVRFLARPVEAALGGGGAAAAYLLGRLGQRVALNSNVGRDSWGAVVGDRLGKARVELSPARPAATAVNVILLSPGGARRSFYYTGDKVDWRRSLEGETPEWLLASGYGQVDAGDLEALGEVFGALRRRGTRIAFDPSPWFEGKVAAGDMLRVWAQVDCLVATEEELAAWHGAAGSEELAIGLLEMGPERVVVKRGGEGAAYAGRGEGSGMLPTERIESANTVGAGDTFNARLLYGLCRGEALREALVAAVGLATRVARQGRGVLGALE